MPGPIPFHIANCRPTSYIVNCFFKANVVYHGYFVDDQILDVLTSGLVIGYISLVVGQTIAVIEYYFF